jgi:hypothetical protein
VRSIVSDTRPAGHNVVRWTGGRAPGRWPPLESISRDWSTLEMY